MTMKNRDKTAARKMQKATGWPYTKCLAKVRETRLAEEQTAQADRNDAAIRATKR